jgi:poly(A) polymerase/tRNA nucleotidyltransferase (CCA-adding enzyme)
LSKLANRLLPESLRPPLSEVGQLWLVGGALRDHFLDRVHPDLDFAVDGQASELARRIADALGAHYYALDRQRDAGRVVLPDHRTLDFVRLRGETIEADLRLRDFTINALATPVADGPELIDPLQGLQDLRDRRLRTCSPTALSDDPVRALRAVRIAHELQLRITPETISMVRQVAPQLAEASAERVRDELARMLEPNSAGALRLAGELGVLQTILPEAAEQPAAFRSGLDLASRLAELLQALVSESRRENLVHGQMALALAGLHAPLTAHLSRTLIGGRTAAQMLELAALFRPLSNGAASILRRTRKLRFSRQEGQLALAIVRHAAADRLHSYSNPVGRSRLLEAVGQAGPEVVLLSLAEVLLAGGGPPEHRHWEHQLQAARAVLEVALGEVQLPPPLINGDQLMKGLELQPGPMIGELLRQIREAQLGGTIEDLEQAIELARQLLVTERSGG